MGLKDLVQNEAQLMKAEIKESSKDLGKDVTQAAIFGALLALSALPFLAFLVIGLGDLINNYWLSSLIVAVICAAVGGGMAYASYKKIKERDFSFPRTRASLNRERDTIVAKVEDIKEATKRRAV
jgi:hypothetical protein